MRRLPAVLLAAGAILGVALAIAGFGRIPFLIGVACLAGAGILAARRTGRAVFALAGIAAAVLLSFVPGLITDRRNAEGIAWTAPKGERIALAETGYAITSSGDDAITARDLDTGKRRWRLDLGREHFAEGLLVRRVGGTLLVVDDEGRLRGIDLKTGKQRWDTPPASDLVLPAIASPEIVATTRCDGERCTAEARSIADGKLRWEAPSDSSPPWLGSPPIAQALQVDRPLWPASAVIVTRDERYEVRQLASGKVVAQGTTAREAIGVTGNLFLRETEKGELSALDVTTGRRAWTRKADGLNAVRAPDGSLDWLGIPDGGLIMIRGLRDMDHLDIGDTLRVLDPRTGKLTERPLGVLGAGGAVVVPADGPPVSAETATAGATPRVPVIGAYLDDEVLADGRRYKAEYEKRGIGATTTQVGWGQRVQPFAGGERAGAVVRDQRSGRERVRYVGESDNVFVRSEGERLVIHDGSRELVVKPERRPIE
jgi:outer membrane protein assembly factor BamB